MKFLDITNFQDIHRILDKVIRHLRDMYQCAFLDANVDKGTKIHNILDLAGNSHPFAQVFK